MKYLPLLLAGALSACGPARLGTSIGSGAVPGASAAPARDSSAAGSQPAFADATLPVPVDANDPTWGSATALVTIVEFSDFQCPYCAAVQSALRDLRGIYGKERLRIVWKDQPLAFHPQAKGAAEAARAVFSFAGNEAFWRFHDLLFANQALLDPVQYLSWAKEAGVADEVKFRQALENHAGSDRIQQSADLARTLDVHATPAFFINGVELVGALPVESFRQVVDDQIQKAENVLANGTPPEQLYGVLLRRNMTDFAETEVAKTGDRDAKGDEDRTVWAVPVEGAPQRGPAAAPVTIVEFSDYQCPFCQRVESTIDQVRTKYGQDVRIVFRNNPLPIHDRAEPAAELAIFAWKTRGEEAFWAAHDLLFARQDDLGDQALESIARELKLDAARAMRAITKHAYRATIDQEVDIADDLEARGTPHFFINGRRLVGSRPFESFRTIIDEELARARKLVEQGTPPKDLYAEIMKSAKTPNPPEKVDITVPAGTRLPEKGGARARVVIQEFSDFECPFCARVQPTLQDLVATYGNRIKFVFRNRLVSGHADAPLAAEAAAEAYRQKGSAGFWKMHDLLFAHQGDENGLKSAALEGYARRVGLDLPAFRSALASRVHQSSVRSDTEAAEAAGIVATPTFVINGYVVRGAQPKSRFRKLIDRALSEAR